MDSCYSPWSSAAVFVSATTAVAGISMLARKETQAGAALLLTATSVAAFTYNKVEAKEDEYAALAVVIFTGLAAFGSLVDLSTSKPAQFNAYGVGVTTRVKDLPDGLRKALRAIGYHKPHIRLHAKETESLFYSGGEGRRGLAVLVDIPSGEYKMLTGSWGGAGLGSAGNSVDLDTNEYPIPPNGAVITGSTGYDGTWVDITLHPSNMIQALPEADPLSPKDRLIMYAFGSLKSGDYRQEVLQDAGATAADVESLISRGFLARNKAGAISVTLAGKNTRKSGAGSSRW